MIKNIHLLNFKSHKDTSLKLENLTILSGQNGVGKSSIIQPFLLLRQTYLKNRLDEILDLNSPLCFLGNANSVIYFLSDKNSKSEMSIILKDETKDYIWNFQKNTNLQQSFLDRTGEQSLTDGFEQLSLFTNNFQYISSLRSWHYESDDYAVTELNQISIQEGKGELVAQYLHTNRNKFVLENLRHPDEESETLLSQVSAWEREISNNVNVVPKDLGGSFDIRYTFNTDNEYGTTDEFSKRNVGFGLSYVLPIIVSILSAEKGSFLLIENPEAHIHPYGISKLTELICLATQAGVQIVVETHSDHVINGILVQCKKFEKTNQKEGIDKANVAIYHFDRDETEHLTIHSQIIVNENGEMGNQPNKFFDQIENDLDNLYSI